ncbi:NAD(P)H-dependent glycerol-3-phosphate dehydrogenase [Parvularcula maris]|uniref:Glycerol-3-phosphate dehydrogenase [NAD(P)+] n=1 Tax=Parvularcula maris TaxID=2965077 RepID=A0A9X2L7V9_9PROT|nr:NAD(P)H-dependent glycerol-3-phosphate dehydrogenase [Parvularcula maris]MCQ8184701.1 NAD(P)-dependent glycerol-3-phosphate dehydrogenase [Parvularcula maris]
MSRVFVAGAGSWGTALGVLLAREGHEVRLWMRSPDKAEAVAEAGENEAYLPGVPLPDLLTPSSDLVDVAGSDACLFVVPAQHARHWMEELRQASSEAALPVALCSKGLERSTLMPMHEVLAEAWPEARGAVLSGPSFAADVARGLPTAVTLACESQAERERWLSLVSAANFRLYASDDPFGAEIGGAVKNVLAIACGIAIGKGFGESAKAALIARGFAELQRFGLAMGAKQETLSGLSGLGDLVLTANSPQSRNFSLGLALGQGAEPAAYLRSQRSVAEGAATARPLTEKARAAGVEMPICEGVAAIVEGRDGVDETIAKLMNRPLRAEGAGKS